MRKGLLAAAAARTALGIVAVPLAPALYRKHFVVLVLLRPTKEVLLAGGFLLRQGDVALLPMLAAAVPLMVLGVWLFYALGRSFEDEADDMADLEDKLPKWGRRILPPKRLKAMASVLERRGTAVVVLGRLAAFPSALLAAAAGASGLKAKQFLPADGAGAALSIVEVLGAGYVLGAAYKRAGPWLTVAGAAVLVVLLVLLGRWLKREESSGGGT
jgi:membrane protein DedA with SNARE-associated domain